jgi:hypothetical protein
MSNPLSNYSSNAVTNPVDSNKTVTTKELSITSLPVPVPSTRDTKYFASLMKEASTTESSDAYGLSADTEGNPKTVYSRISSKSFESSEDNRKDNKKVDNKKSKEYDKKEDKGVASTPAETILNNLQGIYQNPLGGSSAISPEQQIRQLASEIIDKLMITHAADDKNKQEITILFNSTILDGTNVRISKQGDMLDIFFQTMNNQSAALLNQNESLLRKQLQNALKDAKIDIKLEHQTDQNSQNRQQKGRNVLEYDVEG